MARCRREIAECEALLRAGHPDVEGLCLALADWSAELRILEGAGDTICTEVARGSFHSVAGGSIQMDR